MSVEDTLTKARDRAKQMGLPYDGALTPAEAYEVMRGDSSAKLVDVGTACRARVGRPHTRRDRSRAADVSGQPAQSGVHARARAAGRQGFHGHVHLPQRRALAQCGHACHAGGLCRSLQRAARGSKAIKTPQGTAVPKAAGASPDCPGARASAPVCSADHSRGSRHADSRHQQPVG